MQQVALLNQIPKIYSESIVSLKLTQFQILTYFYLLYFVIQKRTRLVRSSNTNVLLCGSLNYEVSKLLFIKTYILNSITETARYKIS